MRRLLLIGTSLALVAAGCDRMSAPIAPDAAAALQVAPPQGTRTVVIPNADAAFGPAVLASCPEGFDLVFTYSGTVTIVETLDRAGNIARLQNVWKTSVAIFNSVTGYSVSGPSYGPDHNTFNSDGSTRLVQDGLLLHLKLPDGTQLVDAGSVEFLIDANGDFTLVAMHGPHPDHVGFPERPVLCALLNH
jgi:hypothetical protein